MSRVAAIQMASGPNIGANLIEAERLIDMAVEDGAELLVLPENFALMGLAEEDKVKACEEQGAGPIQDFLARQAATHGVWIVGGTVPLCSPEAGKVHAACLLYDSSGAVIVRYDKMHLFDVRIKASEENYTESLTIVPGDQVVVVDTPFGRLGLAVCYDLRFPELFRCMLDQGAELFAIPSAFTAFTGKAHWEALVRVRAIENLCYVVAAAQGGYHINGRETYGDSMVVDPWGNVLDRLPSGAGVVCGSVDLGHLRGIRRGFPAIAHRRLHCCSKEQQ
ncbi:MAG: carbon-nitrogen hydrolase family protein [Gammaproteobacteria bacterium]